MEENQQKTRGRPKKKTTPKITYKGNRTFRHDLFKLNVATMKKNTSWKYGVVNTVPVEHCHFFHTYNSHGKKQIHSNAVGGHYHEVTWYMDETTGELKAECGPPIMKYKVKRGGRQKTFEDKVKWFDNASDEAGVEGRWIVDDHRHNIEYLHSEELNQDAVRSINKQTSEAIMQSAPPPQMENADNVGLQEL